MRERNQPKPTDLSVGIIIACIECSMWNDRLLTNKNVNQ